MDFRAFTRDNLASVIAHRLNCESDVCNPFRDIVDHFTPGTSVAPSVHALALRGSRGRWAVLVDGTSREEVRRFVRERAAHLRQPHMIAALATRLIRPRRLHAGGRASDVRVHPISVFMVSDDGITAHKNMAVTSESHRQLWWFEPQMCAEDTPHVPHATLRRAVCSVFFAHYSLTIELRPTTSLQASDELCQCWCVWYATLRASSPEQSSHAILSQMQSKHRNSRGQIDGTHALRVFLHRVFHEVPFLLRSTRSGGTRGVLAALRANGALPADDAMYAVPHAWCCRPA